MYIFNFTDKKFWTDSAINDLKSRLNVKSNTNIAKNVIVFIGDGMGVQTHTASRIYKGKKGPVGPCINKS